MTAASGLPIDATLTVGTVLAEALVLYVGYGAMTSVLEPRVTTVLAGE